MYMQVYLELIQVLRVKLHEYVETYNFFWRLRSPPTFTGFHGAFVPNVRAQCFIFIQMLQ